MRVKKGRVLLRLEPWPQCSKNQLQSSNNKNYKQTIQIATFNVRTLNRIGLLSELTASVVEHKIDIICIQEHRYTHTEDIKYHETGSGWTLATVSAWKKLCQCHSRRGMNAYRIKSVKTLNSIERIQPTMMAATFNGNPRATIISC